jgi:hypothetical protein
MHHLKAFVALILLLAVSCRASAADPISVYVKSQCSKDPVGERIAFKVREGLRRSSSMASVDTYSDSVMQLSIVCIDPDKDKIGSISNYSYAITTTNTEGYYDFQITHGVGTCGTRRVDECAEGLVADIDKAISDAIRRVKDGTFRYKVK